MNIEPKYRLFMIVTLGVAFIFVAPAPTPPIAHTGPIITEPVVFDGSPILQPTPTTPLRSSDGHQVEVPATVTAAKQGPLRSSFNVELSGIDWYRQWEAPDPELAPVFAQAYEKRVVNADASFATVYTKINCGAVVSNMCLWNSQPRYFREGKQLFTSKGGTLSCNEAGPKQRFFMVMYDPPLVRRSGTALAIDVQGVGSIPYLPDTVLIVPYCWELYGYHLILCQQATFAQIQRLGLQQRRATLQIAFMRGGTFTPYRAGSNASWDGEVRRGVSDDVVKRSTYWPLWKSVVPRPSQIDALPTSPKQCYGTAVVAGLPSNEVTPQQASAWREEVMTRLALRRSRPSLTCGTYKTVIVQRKEKFFIKDLSELKRHVAEVVGGDVSVAVLEDMSFRDQLQLAIDADLLIGIHGNGLTWVTMMKNTSALLELWPHVPYNGNYYHLATRANVKLFSSNGDATCGQRCSANFVANLQRDKKLADIRAFLDGVHCQKQFFDASASYMRERAEIKAKKEAKRRAKQGLS